MELKEENDLLRKNLAICQKTVQKLTKEKQILLNELFTVDPGNPLIDSMQQ